MTGGRRGASGGADERFGVIKVVEWDVGRYCERGVG